MLHAAASLQRQPLIATALLAATGSGYTIALYILFCAIVSIIATAMMPDYTNKDISEEHDRP
jgi:general stress protein CsbA